MVFAAGEILDAADLNDLSNNTVTTTGNITVGGRLIVPYKKYVTADQASAANNTTYANVTDLVLPMLANIAYEFELFIMYAATAVADFKIKLAGPSGADLTQWKFLGKNASLAEVTGSPAAGGEVIGLGGNGAAVKQQFWASGVIINDVNAGNLQVTVAKNTAEASTHTVYKWSRMRLEPLA